MSEPTPYDESQAAAWDAFVAESANGTLLHTRAYLGYHGDRFTDASLTWHDGDRLVALLPAALAPGDPKTVVSHPGLTYGGLVLPPSAAPEVVVEQLAAALAHYGSRGATRLVYKRVPPMYHRPPTDVDLYAAFRAGGTWTRSDVSAAVPLDVPERFSEMRRRNLRKAEAAVSVRPGGFAEFWPVLEAVLRERHGTRPVHTVAEIEDLARRCPGAIRCVVATEADEVVAGTVLYDTGPVVHAQYLASSARGFDRSALDAVVAAASREARAAGARWFDFGISTEEGGRVLNAGLHRYKASFGAIALTYDHFDLPCPG